MEGTCYDGLLWQSDLSSPMVNFKKYLEITIDFVFSSQFGKIIPTFLLLRNF